MKNSEVKLFSKTLEPLNEKIFLERMEKIVRYQNLLIREIQNDIQVFTSMTNDGEHYFGLIPSYVDASINQQIFENLMDQSESNLIILRDLQSFYQDLARESAV